MEREVYLEDRLTPIEALMWRLGTDPGLSACFGSVTFLDREPDPERFRARVAGSIASLSRFRQRIEHVALPVPTLVWADDPDFDLSHHLRWERCPGAGRERDVLEVAAALVAEPLDTDRPPWLFVVVTGLPGGRAALIQRMHHAITDGKGGIRLSERFIDLEPDPGPPPPDPFAVEPEPAPSSSWLERAVNSTIDRAAGALRGAGDATRWAVGGLGDPARFVQTASDAAEVARSLRRQLMVADRSRSPLWTARSSRRRLVAGSVEFDPVRRAATALGVSINDVFVTAVLRGAATYHRLHDRPVDELRVAIPVSTRSDTKAGGNAFSPTRVLLPSGSGLTGEAHLRQVADLLSQTKTERATALIEPVAAVADLVPTALLRSTVARQAATIDLTASNLRAAPIPLYVAGALIEATYALGPLSGTAVNATMLSYNGRIDIGVHVDAAAVSDPELLRDSIVAAFHELCGRPVGAS
jgi:diacylglycerol O-acyltransferase / wax synthase